MIQQDLEASKIENIIHKLAMGDLSVLKQAQLTYVDEEEYPKSLMEAQNIVVRAKAEFDKFPAEVKNSSIILLRNMSARSEQRNFSKKCHLITMTLQSIRKKKQTKHSTPK